MSVFGSPQEHAANPPETWRVVKVAERCWQVRPAGADYALETFTTRKAALAAIGDGFTRRLYDKESRWYAGEAIAGWRQYAECSA